MPSFLDSPDLVLVATIVGVAGLGTASLVLLWEAIRRWLQDRAATQALERVGREGKGSRREGDTASRGSVVKEEVAGPAWLEPVLLYLPQREDVRRILDQAGLRWSVGSMVLVSLGLSLGLGLAAATVVPGLLIPVLMAALGSYLPTAYVKFRQARRRRAFEEHFSEAIDLLARAARAGHSLSAGLQLVAEEAEEPVASEFRQIYEEQRFGLPLTDSLLGLADRMNLVDVRIFVTSVLIQRESGGNLAENLDGLSSVIRGRFRFKRDVRTKSAHGRITAAAVGAAPVIAGVGMYALNPDYMSPLFEEPLGRALLITGGMMMLVGFVVIRRMADLET